MKNFPTWAIALCSIAIFVLVLGCACFSSFVSAHNYGNAMEARLTAVQSDNRNILSQYGQKVQEAAQVPDSYAADLQKVTQSAIAGRYGDKGSQATFQALREENPKLDPSLYVQIEQIIEAGRNNFEAGQRTQLDVKRQYTTALGSFWQGMWLHAAGYPRVNLADFDIVSTSRADNAEKTKLENGIIKLH